MYMTFTEEQAVQIRKRGLTVIEFKRCVRKGINIAVYFLRKTLDAFSKAVSAVSNEIHSLFDYVKQIIEDAHKSRGNKTVHRYKFVKYLSKLGYDKRKMRTENRHVWLARSNC